MPKIFDKDTPMYPHSAAYAREHNELPMYRASLQANVACKEAIEKAVAAHYADNHLDVKSILEDVNAEFSMERIKSVLANTVQLKDWDGRFSRDNKAWAKTVLVAEDTDGWGNNRNISFMVDRSHPAILDGFITHFRKELEKAPQEKKPSILDKLKSPLPDGVSTPKSKAQEL